MPFPIYNTGTVSVAEGGTVVEGAGVYWSKMHVRGGDTFRIGAVSVTITERIDNEHFGIEPWPGETATDVEYSVTNGSLERVVGLSSFEDTHRLITSMNSEGYIHYVGPDLSEPDPADGYDGQFAQKLPGGQTWVKSEAEWVYIGIYRGLSIKGVWSNIVTYYPGDVTSYSGSSYISLDENLNKRPDLNLAVEWQVLASQGAQGQGIQPNATGTLSDRATNDGASKGFVFLRTDVTPFQLYVKASASSGDWAGPTPVSSTFDGTTFRGVDVASATNTDISAAGDFIFITGTTEIASFTLPVGRQRLVRFGGALTVKSNSDIFLPSGADYETGAGDMMLLRAFGANLVVATIFPNTTGRMQALLGASATGKALLTSASGDAVKTLLGAFGAVRQQIFTSSGTYTAHADMAFCIIECVGGGGSGGSVQGSASNNFGGGGGGSGGYSRKLATKADIGVSKAVTVGGAGATPTAGATNGNAGGATSLGTLCVANGGAGGLAGTTGQVGQGGSGALTSGAVGDVVAGGDSGAGGVFSSNVTITMPGGAGGSAYFGGGARGSYSGGATNGYSALGYGGGGGGAYAAFTASNVAGGAAMAGVVIITEFCIK